MTAELTTVPNFSGTIFGISGTHFLQQGTFALTILCAISGLAIIPVLCDSEGRIGSFAA